MCVSVCECVPECECVRVCEWAKKGVGEGARECMREKKQVGQGLASVRTKAICDEIGQSKGAANSNNDRLAYRFVRGGRKAGGQNKKKEKEFTRHTHTHTHTDTHTHTHTHTHTFFSLSRTTANGCS